MKNLSNSKIEKSKGFKANSIENIIKSKYPTEFDQMILNDDIDRKNICFVRYQAKTLNRTVKKITFPLFGEIEKDFKENFCGGEQNHGSIKKNPSDFIDNIINKDGVKIETYDMLNNKKLAYYEIPVETKEGKVLIEQPTYFIPSLTKYYSCQKCSGAQYVTCTDQECRGRHEWTCTKCNGEGKVTCKKCRGEGETTCEKCGGRHEYRCPTCGGKGELTCSHCGGSGWYKRVGESEKRCPYCSGTGKRKCSLRSDSGNMLGAAFKMATEKEYCKGKGFIICEKCKPNGKITCKKCQGSGEVICKECDGKGTIVCKICYGDNERYGKIDCPTCLTMGEIGEIVIVETKIELKNDESLFGFGKELPKLNFPESKQLEIIKRHTNPNYQLQETYYKVVDKSGEEVSRLDTDEFSENIIPKIRNKLNISLDDYPKLLQEYIYYEIVPSLTLSYKHILTNTEHELSFIAIDSNDPATVFHSKPDETALEKPSFKEKLSQLFSRAFSTKKYKEKIDKRNTIVLLIHLAKADQIVEHEEKVFLSKQIQDLDNFSISEKKLLFNLMSSSELPEIKKRYARFSNKEIEDEAKKHLLEFSKLEGGLEESENKKLDEITSLIDNSRQSKFANIFLNFLSTWQISIPLIISILSIIFLAFWLLIFEKYEYEEEFTEESTEVVLEAKSNNRGESSAKKEVENDKLHKENGSSIETKSEQLEVKFPGYKQSESGLFYKFYTDVDDTLFPKVGDFVEVDMIYATEDTILFDSRDLPNQMQMPMVESVHYGDIYEGMSMMNKGDSAVFICNADSVLAKLFRFSTIPPELDPVEYIYFHVKMINIMSKNEMDVKKEAEIKQLAEKEKGLRDAFLSENYPNAIPTESGLYLINEKLGSGEKPIAGQKVKVHYTGKFLDGTKFDSSFDRGQPFEFTLGQGQVIMGWDEGIAMMKTGGKAVFVIPSDMAYGPLGRGSIPPSSTLVFEVELIEIENSDSQKLEFQSINLTSFNLSAIPDSLSGCSCLFSSSIEKYNSDDFWYFDDMGDNCIISIDNEIILLKPKADKYYNEKFTVYIQNKKKIDEDFESTEYNAELVIIDKKGNKIIKKIYGICGC